MSDDIDIGHLSRILAVDPGNTMSAYVLIEADTRAVITSGKAPNEGLRLALPMLALDACVAIEMIASYGMPVGAEVFVTCLWIGRFIERVRYAPVDLVYRRDIKLHHCGSARAKDSNVTQALVDRFAPGQPNRGKGTKAAPGWFFGFKADVWAAYALGVYVADRAEGLAA